MPGDSAHFDVAVDGLPWTMEWFDEMVNKIDLMKSELFDGKLACLTILRETESGLIRCGLIRYGLIRSGLIRYGLIRDGLIKYGMIRGWTDRRSRSQVPVF